MNNLVEKTKEIKLKEEKEEYFFLNLLDFHVIQQIFIKIVNADLFIEENKNLTISKNERKLFQHFNKKFENCLSFSLVCKHFNLVSKNTLFKINIYEEEKIESINYIIYLKLNFIKPYVIFETKELYEIESKQEFVDNMLISSSKYGFYDLIELLISHGADINYETLDRKEVSMTPLSESCRRGNLKTTKELIKYGSDIHQIQEFNYTLLLHGCCGGNLNLVKYCIAEGLSIHSLNDSQETPLTGACIHGHIDIVKHLISLGADINHQNRKNETLLFPACHSNNLELIQFLLDLGLNINHRSSEDKTCIFPYYPKFVNLKTTKFLISKGADLSVKFRDETLLEWVMGNKKTPDPKLVKLLEKYC